MSVSWHKIQLFDGTLNKTSKSIYKGASCLMQLQNWLSASKMHINKCSYADSGTSGPRHTIPEMPRVKSTDVE